RLQPWGAWTVATHPAFRSDTCALAHVAPLLAGASTLIPAASSWQTLPGRPLASRRSRMSACDLVIPEGRAFTSGSAANLRASRIRSIARSVVCQLTGAFAEFERTIIRHRVKAGLKRAVAQGVKLGRPKIDKAIERKVRKQLAKGFGILKVARSLGLGTGTVQRIARELG